MKTVFLSIVNLQLTVSNARVNIQGTITPVDDDKITYERNCSI